MKNQSNTLRRSRTHLMIQIGGLVSKSGLLDTFNIQVGDDLKDYESFHKAARLLGFLRYSLEQFDESEASMSECEKSGERLLRYG